MKKKQNIDKRPLIILYFIISLFFVLFALRLFQYQVVDYQAIVKQADSRISRKIILPAKRGKITDTAGNILAYSLEVNRVYFIKSQSKNMQIELAELQNAIGEIDIATIEQTIVEGTEDRVLIVDQLAQDKLKLVESLSHASLETEAKTERVYPNETLAAHLLGYTDIDGIGLHGLEYTQNELLSGKKGYIETRTDENGRKIAFSEADVVEPINGYTIETTIDQTIQYYVETAIKSGREVSEAIKVMAVVQDAKNGDILAMASFPDYDPNDRMQPIYPEQVEALNNRAEDVSEVAIMSQYWRNPVIEEVYEPGSTFKIFIGAVGLEEGATSYHHSYYCDGGETVTGQRIKCWYHAGHGTQNLVEGFQNSCNVVFMNIVKALGADKVYQYIKTFQLDQKSGIPLNGEASPQLTSIDKLMPVDLARIGFGHNISLTPLQMMKVLGVISNHGVLTQPRLVKRILDEDGQVVKTYDPNVIGQVISQKTADDVLGILETVVTDGSGRRAAIPGYRIGGKTGTSIKLINGKYVDDDLVFSSFAAIAPTDDPQINLIVIVDEPRSKNVHGSTVATPIAREILVNVLQYLEIEPTTDTALTTFTAPNLIGMSLKDALASAKKINVELVDAAGGALDKVDQSLIIGKQYPLEGTLISPGSQIYIQTK